MLTITFQYVAEFVLLDKNNYSAAPKILFKNLHSIISPEVVSARESVH